MKYYNNLFIHVFNFIKKFSAGQDEKSIVLSVELAISAVISMLVMVNIFLCQYYIFNDFHLWVVWLAVALSIVLQVLNHFAFSYKNRFKKLIKKSHDKYYLILILWLIVFVECMFFMTIGIR